MKCTIFCLDPTSCNGMLRSCISSLMAPWSSGNRRFWVVSATCWVVMGSSTLARFCSHSHSSLEKETKGTNAQNSEIPHPSLPVQSKDHLCRKCVILKLCLAVSKALMARPQERVNVPVLTCFTFSLGNTNRIGPPKIGITACRRSFNPFSL